MVLLPSPDCDAYLVILYHAMLYGTFGWRRRRTRDAKPGVQAAGIIGKLHEADRM